MHFTALRMIGACLLLMLAFAPTVRADCKDWPLWDGFRSRFLSEDGRVIDTSTSAMHSTSEGQAYGLFFALVANDRASFDLMLQWTQTHLASGSLASRLPAWQWGKREDGTWGLKSDSNASDADLWMAYTLAEASRLWHYAPYMELSQSLSERILREQTLVLPSLGHMLLPGRWGFQLQPDLVQLNPSYLPIQLVRRMAILYPHSGWPGLVKPSIDLLIRSAPKGFAPDWVLYRYDNGFEPAIEKRAIGSYDAIRVYLWAGMLAPQDQVRAELIKVFTPMIDYTVRTGFPPLEVDTIVGTMHGEGSPGFSAAMLPLLVSSGRDAARQRQQTRIMSSGTLVRHDNYYEQALSLFALGWVNRRYTFAADGALVPQWGC